MTGVRWQDLAREQDGVFAVWQLVAAGWTRRRVQTAVRDQQVLNDGVYLAGFSPPTQRQRWRAAALTTPTSVLSHASAAGYWGLRADPGLFETVTRPGRRNPRRSGRVRVHYSATLPPNIVSDDGIWITTPQRTAIDLSFHLGDWERRKMLRAGLRTGLLTIASMRVALDDHRGRRGLLVLRSLTDRYEQLPFHRCRSDAEAYALEVLDDAHRPPPEVNVRHAGEEADLSWRDLRLIIEIDGPQYHRDKVEDARKTRKWTAAGWTVRRISSDDVFAHPEFLLALAPNTRRATVRGTKTGVRHG